MVNFIKKIFQGEIDESVHRQFVRFGRGIFGNRAAINFKTNGKVKLTTGFEFANDLVELIASVCKKIKVNGILLTRQDPCEFGLQGKKKKGIFESEINKELNAEEIRKICEKAYFTLFDCSCDSIELKIKKKLPKPGKSNERKINDTFCILEADKKYEKSIMQDFLFDVQGKRVKIVHLFEINDIVLPEGEKDFEEIRKKAKRKGKIIRKINSDGKEQIKEKDFAA